jgi:two-component system sensor histidine kinase KdpD
LTVEALEGLEVIPRRPIPYQGVVLEEMDTGAIIARNPTVALVDELAHTNAPGSKHEKRWQDVEDIRDHGITVISTLNIQHLESLNDVVAGITGIRVRETVPDAVIENADEVEIVDISPQALRARMRHGNVYPPEQARQALDSFFTESNLAALRDLALRRVSLEAEQKLSTYMRENALKGWEAMERCLVLLDNTPASEVAVRRAWRLAHGLNADLVAAYPATLLREQGMTHILTVAMDLNARLRELPGEDLARELGEVLAQEGVTHLTLIARGGRGIAGFRRQTLADSLLRRFPRLDVHLIGEA